MNLNMLHTGFVSRERLLTFEQNPDWEDGK